uniref:Uncharacterized protein n=1 Tax=Eptatretus burgeri TaxID=7764 RepID=A0A8C4QLI0_EPTBU
MSTLMNPTRVLVVAPAATCSHDNLTVAIIMVDQKGKAPIHALVQITHNDAILDKKKVQLEQSHPALIKLKVTPVDEKKWKEDFVHLVVKVDDMQDLKTIIPLTSRRGHIFIQTDQPIYMPNSDVKSWLFAVTRQLNPIPFPLVVDIVNPDGVVVKRMKKSDWQVERMVVLEPFHIPAITSPLIHSATENCPVSSHHHFATWTAV